MVHTTLSTDRLDFEMQSHGATSSWPSTRESASKVLICARRNHPQGRDHERRHNAVLRALADKYLQCSTPRSRRRNIAANNLVRRFRISGAAWLVT